MFVTNILNGYRQADYVPDFSTNKSAKQQAAIENYVPDFHTNESVNRPAIETPPLASKRSKNAVISSASSENLPLSSKPKPYKNVTASASMYFWIT
jgi:hypothetical protein